MYILRAVTIVLLFFNKRYGRYGYRVEGRPTSDEVPLLYCRDTVTKKSIKYIIQPKIELIIKNKYLTFLHNTLLILLFLIIL